MSTQLTQTTQLKRELEQENGKLLSQMSSDVKTYSNAKKLKVALTLVSDQKHKLLDERKRLKTQITSLQKQISKSSSNAGAEITKLIERNDALNRKVIEMEAKNNGYDARLAQSERESSDLTEQLSKKEEDFQRLQGIKEKLMSKVKNLEDSMARIRDRQQVDVESNQEELTVKQREIDSLKEALRRISRQVQDLNRERKDLKTDIDSYREDLKQEHSKKEGLLLELADVKMQFAEQSSKPWKTAYEAATEEREKLLGEVRALKEDRFQFEAKHLDMTHEIKKSKSLQNQLLSKNAEIAQLKAKLTVKGHADSVAADQASIDQRELKRAHEATISKSRQLLKNNKELREEVKLLTSRLETGSQVGTSRALSSFRSTNSNSFSDLEMRYKELEKRVSTNLTGTESSTTVSLGPVSDNNTPRIPRMINDSSEVALPSEQPDVTQVSREFTKRLEQLSHRTATIDSHDSNRLSSPAHQESSADSEVAWANN